MSKVVGIGFARTGCTTLGAALQTLGYKHCRTRMDLLYHVLKGDDGAVDELVRIASKYDSFSDWPWSLIYPALDAAFPGSRFILTIRNDDPWLRSYRGMIERGKRTPKLDRTRRYLFGSENPTDVDLLSAYRSHNESVRDYLRGRTSLLEVDWTHGDGWEKLCAFLGKPVPDAPFPHENRSLIAA